MCQNAGMDENRAWRRREEEVDGSVVLGFIQLGRLMSRLLNRAANEDSPGGDLSPLNRAVFEQVIKPGSRRGRNGARHARELGISRQAWWQTVKELERQQLVSRQQHEWRPTGYGSMFRAQSSAAADLERTLADAKVLWDRPALRSQLLTLLDCVGKIELAATLSNMWRRHGFIAKPIKPLPRQRRPSSG